MNDFYKIDRPTTEQFIEAIENYSYFTMEQFNQKKKQLKVYFSDLWNCDVALSWQSVTNTGGYPIIYPADVSLNELMENIDKDFQTLSEEEQAHQIELFDCYANTL